MKEGFILRTSDGHYYVSDKYAKLARIVNVDRRTFKLWCDKIKNKQIKVKGHIIIKAVIV